MDGLHEELRVEHEVVGVALEGDALQHLTAVDAEAAVEVAEVLAEGEVLHERQKAIGQILIDRHSAVQRLGARADAAAQHHVADAQLDEADRQRDDAAVVLVIGVDHHHHVGAVPGPRGNRSSDCRRSRGSRGGRSPSGPCRGRFAPCGRCCRRPRGSPRPPPRPARRPASPPACARRCKPASRPRRGADASAAAPIGLEDAIHVKELWRRRRCGRSRRGMMRVLRRRCGTVRGGLSSRLSDAGRLGKAHPPPSCNEERGQGEDVRRRAVAEIIVTRVGRIGISLAGASAARPHGDA